MRGTLTVVVCMGLLMLLIGVLPSFATVAIGGLGLAATVTMVQVLHATIIQVKAPQRFHGRVLSLYASVTWGALPVGWLVRHPGFWRFDLEVADSLPDDLFAAPANPVATRQASGRAARGSRAMSE